MLPFYLGSLGFLTDFDIADIKDVLTSALTPPDSPSEDNFTTTKKLKTLTQCSRMRLSVTIYRHRPRQRSLLVTRRELARTRSNTWTSLDAPLADGIGNTIGGTTENINTCTIQEEQLTKNTLASPHSPKTSSPLHGSFDLGRPPKMTPQESTASSKSSDSPLGRGGAQLDDLALLRSAGGSLSKILGGESGRKVPKESGSNSHLESPFPGAAGSAIPVETFHVLNEVVVDRGPSAYMSQLELFVGGKHLTSVQADGLVLSTPTGSTAYSVRDIFCRSFDARRLFLTH